MQNGLSEGVGHASEARASVSAWIRSASLRLWARWVSGPPRGAPPRRIVGLGIEASRIAPWSDVSRSRRKGLAVQEQSLAGESLLSSPVPVVSRMDPSWLGLGG